MCVYIGEGCDKDRSLSILVAPPQRTTSVVVGTKPSAYDSWFKPKAWPIGLTGLELNGCLLDRSLNDALHTISYYGFLRMIHFCSL